MSPAISVVDLCKSFGSNQALKRVSLTVNPGERVALLGASGSGKSTLLRHLCGLLASDTDSGRVEVHGRVVQDHGRLAADIRDQRAAIAMIFQQFNLVERLPVMTNVLAGALHRQPIWRNLLHRFPAHEYQRAYEAANDFDAGGDDSTAFGIAYVYKAAKWLELYAGGKLHSLDRSGENFDDVTILALGSRIKF